MLFPWSVWWWVKVDETSPHFDSGGWTFWPQRFRVCLWCQWCREGDRWKKTTLKLHGFFSWISNCWGVLFGVFSWQSASSDFFPCWSHQRADPNWRRSSGISTSDEWNFISVMVKRHDYWVSSLRRHLVGRTLWHKNWNPSLKKLVKSLCEKSFETEGVDPARCWPSKIALFGGEEKKMTTLAAWKTAKRAV